MLPLTLGSFLYVTVLNGTRPSADCCGSFISAGRETAAGRLEVDGIRLHNDNAADDLRSHLFADPTERSRLETARWQRYKLFIPSKPK